MPADSYCAHARGHPVHGPYHGTVAVDGENVYRMRNVYELRRRVGMVFPLPVGLCWEEGQIVLDPDREVQGALRLVFQFFRETGTAYGVIQRFAEKELKFPKRAYGGVCFALDVLKGFIPVLVAGLVGEVSWEVRGPWVGAFVNGTVTATGTALNSPELPLPSCPEKLLPQQRTPPSAKRPQT